MHVRDLDEVVQVHESVWETLETPCTELMPRC